MPEGALFDRLSRLIHELSHRYSSPPFPPHVTLLGQAPGSREDLINKCAELAAALKPFRVSLKGLDCLDEFYRALFIRVEETTSVMIANAMAGKLIAGVNNRS